MKKLSLCLYGALFAVTVSLLSSTDTGKAIKGDIETLTAEASDAGKEAAEQFFGLSNAERDQHPWTIGRTFGNCLYKNGIEQKFADCADADSIAAWKECCHDKTKADLSAATAAASFKQTMSQGIFGMKKKNKQ